MTKYLADTNILLRHVLNDVPSQARQVENYLSQAKEEKIAILVCVVTIFEMAFALTSFYHFKKQEIITYLKAVIAMTYLDIEERKILYNALLLYGSEKADFVDAYLFTKAQDQAAEVLSFDKDFRKLKNQRKRLMLKEVR